MAGRGDLRMNPGDVTKAIAANLAARGLLDGARVGVDDQDKMAAALDAVGVRDEEFRKLSELFRFDKLNSENDPAGSLSHVTALKEWTDEFRARHSMSDDLILLSAPADEAEWISPEQAQFVYSIHDSAVYSAGAETLSDPSFIRQHTQDGLNRWPTIGAFLVWYTSRRTPTKS